MRDEAVEPLGRKRVGVIVSPHVSGRFVERFSRDLEGRDHVGLIYSEVREALRDGRRSKTKPAWAAYQSRTSNTDGSRFVWNRERTRVYVIVQARKSSQHDPDRFDESWVVKTVLPNVSDNDELMEHRRRYIEETMRRGRKR